MDLGRMRGMSLLTASNLLIRPHVLEELKMANIRRPSSQIVQTYLRQAVVIAGFASLAVGLLLVVWRPWFFFSYASLFIAALVLSIVAMAQKRVWLGLTLLLLTITVPPTVFLVWHAQVADTAFRPPIEKPAYPIGQGPMVLIDEAHSNFHTATGRYLPFADLLRRDGYVVRASAAQFTAKALEAGRVLVMANAVAALTTEEVAVVRDWVAGGGSLLLIADHPPFDTAAKDLGKAFGIRFSDGTAVDPNDSSDHLVFRRSDGTLMDHLITKGIDEVATFTGTSFQVDATGQPLLVFGPAVYLRQENDTNPRSLKGHLQGAVLPFSKGRVAVFGEAAMFSAQRTRLDRTPMGMNASIAKQNPQFLLNVMHWLTWLDEQH